MSDSLIAITFALPTESSALRDQLAETHKANDFTSGKIADRPVAVCHTGVGAAHCNRCIEALLHKARPRLVISSGLAGAVDDRLAVGDLILAENFSDSNLLSRARKILGDRTPRVSKLFTSASIVDSISERNEIARASGAAAVDMETGSISEICKAHGIPLLSLRAISDSPSEAFPAPPQVLFDIERQRTSYSRLLTYLLKHPAVIAKLTRFSKRIAQVRAKLAEALVMLIREL